MKDNGLLQGLAEQYLGKKGAPDYPYILCKRNDRIEVTYRLHDPMWEGLKPVRRNGQTTYELDPKFNLKIEPDGTCFIPDTPANRAKLERLSQPTQTVDKRVRRNGITGKDETYEVTTITPPKYEKMEKNIFTSAMVKELADAVRAELANEGTEPEREEEPEFRETNHGARQTRTRRVKQDPLLDPIER